MKILANITSVAEPWLSNVLATASAVEVKERNVKQVLAHPKFRPGTQVIAYKILMGWENLESVTLTGLAPKDDQILHHRSGEPWYLNDLLPGYANHPPEAHPFYNPADPQVLFDTLEEVQRLRALGYTAARTDEPFHVFKSALDGDMAEFDSLESYFTAWQDLLSAIAAGLPVGPDRRRWLMYPAFHWPDVVPYSRMAVACGSISMENYPAGIGLFPKTGNAVGLPEQMRYGENANNWFYGTSYGHVDRNTNIQDSLFHYPLAGLPVIAWGGSGHAAIRIARLFAERGWTIYFCLWRLYDKNGNLPAWLWNEVE